MSNHTRHGPRFAGSTMDLSRAVLIPDSRMSNRKLWDELDAKGKRKRVQRDIEREHCQAPRQPKRKTITLAKVRCLDESE